MPTFLRFALISPLVLAACVVGGQAVPAEASPMDFAAQRPIEQVADPLRPGPQGRESVVLGALTVDDEASSALGPWAAPLVTEPTVDLTGVLAEVKRNAGSLQRCYEDRLRNVPDLKGSIVIHAHITPTGEVQGQCITEDELGDLAMVKCVNDLISKGRYPTSHSQTVDVMFPFEFTPPALKG